LTARCGIEILMRKKTPTSQRAKPSGKLYSYSATDTGKKQANKYHRGRFIKERPQKVKLLTKLQLINEFAISRQIRTLEVIQKLATTADHLQKTATRVVIFDVLLEVVRKTVNAGRKQRNLNLGRTRVSRCTLELSDNLTLLNC